MCPTILRNFRLLLLFVSLWLCLLIAWNKRALVQAHVAATPAASTQQPVSNGRITYATNHRRGDQRIYVINADGRSHFEFLDNGARDLRPAWSADGTKLAFERSRDIFTVNHDGSDLRRLTTSNADETSPTWSPDGTRLAFIRSNDLYTVKADGTEMQKITNLSTDVCRLSCNVYDLDWSPDGAKLLFVQSGRLRTCNPDGSELAHLAPTITNVASAAWSPDSARIVIVTGNILPGPGVIQIINADGSNLTRLTASANNRTPVFSPDGQKLAFVRGTELFTMNVDGTDEAKMRDTPIGPVVSVSESNPESGLSWQRVPATQALAGVISGRVIDMDRRGVPWGRIECNGRVTRTDRDGYYSFGNLPLADYTVSLSPLFFSPPQFAYVFNLRGGDAVLNFAAAAVRHTISGRVTDTSNTPLRDVSVGFRRSDNGFSAEDVTTMTDENGFYRLTNLLPRDGTEAVLFSVFPSAPYARFQPFKFDLPRLTEDLTVNFVGTRLPIPITGRVVDAEERGISGVTITLSGAGNRTVTTDAQGRFNLGTALGGLDYTVTATKEGLTFAPASRNLKLLSFGDGLLFRSGISLLTLVSPASLKVEPLATEGLVTAFGANLATTTASSSSQLGATQLGGVRVEIESEGARATLGLTFASPTQLNLTLYFWNQAGEALFTVFSTTTNRAIAAGAVEFARIAPALFTANSNGQGVAAAVALRVLPDNRQTFEPVARFDTALRQFVAVPLDLGAADEQLFLVLYGLGIKNRNSLDAVKCQVGGVDAPVTFAGRAPNFLALDQINVRLPRELAGRGEVDVVLTVEGKTANTVRVAIR